MIDRYAHDWISFVIVLSRSSQLMKINAVTAPHSSAAMKPGRSMGRIPEKLFVIDRAIATAGLANDVDDVNQYAAVI